MLYLRSWFGGCAGEEAVDEGVGGRVERCKRLDEGGDRQVGLRARHLPKHLQQVEHDVRTPATDENYEKKHNYLGAKKKLIQHWPTTMTSVILTLLILARGMMPRELARRLPRSSSSSPKDAKPCPETETGFIFKFGQIKGL